MDTLVAPQIDAKFEAMHFSIVSLVDDVIGMQNQTIEDEKKMSEAREKLQEKLIIHKALGIFKFIGASLSIFGGVGTAVGGLVGTVANVADSMIFTVGVPTPRKIIQDVNKFANSFKTDIEKIYDSYQNAVKTAKETVDKSIQEVEKLKKQCPEDSAELNKTEQLLRGTRSELDANNDALDPKSQKHVDSKIDTVKKYFNEIGSKITSKEAKEFMNRGFQIFNILSKASDFLTATYDEEKKISEIDANIKKLKNQYAALTVFEQGIYDTLLPKMKEIRSSIGAMEDRVKTQSHVQLDMSRWQIKEILGRVAQLVKGMRSSGELAKYADLLEQSTDEIASGLNLMMDIYDRIDSYRENADLATYIANVGSSTPRFGDVQLNDKITALDALLQSNLVLQRHKSAIQAFRQHYFPFASITLERYELPKSLQMNDTTSLIDESVRILNDLQTKIKDNDISIGGYSKFIKFDRNTSFFTWPHQKWNDQISKLLKGENVTLNADILNGMRDSAVKFNDLRLKFVLQNETLQPHLDGILQNYDVSLEIVDNCYYRCNDRIYYISFGEVLSFDFSFERDPKNGRPQRYNDVYDKISRNKPFLSPYTTWNIKLKNKDRNNRMDFTKLETFIHEPMNLALVGVGQFLDRELVVPEICNNQHHVRELS